MDWDDVAGLRAVVVVDVVVELSPVVVTEDVGFCAAWIRLGDEDLPSEAWWALRACIAMRYSDWALVWPSRSPDLIISWNCL